MSSSIGRACLFALGVFSGACATARPPSDLSVLDPPSPARSLSSIDQAAQGLERRLSEEGAEGFEVLAARPALAALHARLEAVLRPAWRPEPAPDFSPQVSAAFVAPVTIAPVKLVAPVKRAPPAPTFSMSLGGFGDRDLAQSIWRELASAAPEALQGLSPRFSDSDGGVTLRAGAFANRAEAERRCGMLSGLGAACDIVSTRAASPKPKTQSPEVGG